MSESTQTDPSHVVILSGGVGGAKLVLGMSQIVTHEQLTVIANTGDDFEHLGLSISPDLDTLMYTLGGLVNPETGWGCRDESWNFMGALEKLGAPTWFRLGDRDLATHIERSRRLTAGKTLTETTAELCTRLGVHARILPMSNDVVRTKIITPNDAIDFQHYFVREQAKPAITGLEYRGADDAQAAPGVIEALQAPGLAAIIIAPSNPWLSVNPILAIDAIRAAIIESPAPVIAVSPIVDGAAIKGPTAKIMRELGLDASALAIAQHYRELLDAFILDRTDQQMTARIEALGLRVVSIDTIMKCLDDKTRVAGAALELAQALSGITK